MEQVLPNVWRVPVPLTGSPLRELNAYLFRGEDRWLLMDTGFKHPDCRAALNAALTELRVDRDKLDILLTHAHSDHSGLAPEFVGPGRSIYISRVDLWQFTDPEYWTVKRTKNFVEEGFSPEELASLDSNPGKRMAPGPCDRHSPLEDGDLLQCGDYTLEAIATPGHTPGHMCYYLREEKVMFTGDHVLFDITPNITNWPQMGNALGHYLESLDKIAGYEVKTAFPGHRERGDFYARIDALKAHHTRRLAEALRLVEEYPDSTAYELAGHMRWKVHGKTDSWTDFPLSQKWFAVGEAQAHLDLLMAQGKLDRRQDGKVYRYKTV